VLVMQPPPAEGSAVVAEDVLIRRALDGDAEAFGALVEQYQSHVYNLCLRMLGRPADAEDAAQETFVRAYRQLHSYQPERKFSTWLLSIAAHYCIDQLRRKSWVSLDSLPFFDRAAPDREEPERATLEGEARDEMQELLSVLPLKYRTPVLLRYWYDMSNAEIAETLGLTEGAVKTRLFRAREMLEQELRAGRAGASLRPVPPEPIGSANELSDE
jgi:RNA polymerase sigma-70 factor (ECF subfamily)